MSNWAIGQGITGLLGSGNLRERRKEERETMDIMDNQLRQDNIDSENAQLRAQQYEKQISEFADKLLAPDRNRINEKSKLLGKKVREQLMIHGGDYQKFLASGGHAVLQNYKDSVINSEESSIYMENKKNTEFILKVQSEGKGHLLTPTDIANFKRYGETGEGRITYSGMLNDIEMPDADLYEWGQEIPAIDILQKNYAQIYGNYKLTYPDAGEPSDYDLQVYVEQHYKGRGKEWQRQMAIEREKNDHIEKLSQQQADVLKEYYKSQNRKKGTKTYTDAQGNEIEIDEATGQVAKNPDQKAKDGVGGYTRLQSVEVQNAFSRIQARKLADIEKGGWLPKEMEALSEPIAPKDLTAQDQGRPERGWLWDSNVSGSEKGGIGYDIQGLINNSYSPSGARRLYKSVQPEVAKALFGKDAKIDIANGKILGWQPSGKTFFPDGTRIMDNEDEVILDEYNTDYKIKDVISVFVGKNAETQSDNIVMDLMDGDKVHKKSGEKRKAIFGNSDLRPQMAIVLEDPKTGRQFYEVFDPMDSATAQKINVGLGDMNNLAPISEDLFNQNNQNAASLKSNKEKETALTTYWDALEGNKQIFANIASETLALSDSGQYTGRRDNLYKGFYAGMAQSQGMNSEEDLMTITNNPSLSLTKDVKEWDEMGFRYKKPQGGTGTLAEMIKDGQYSDEQIVMTLIQFAQKRSASDVPMLNQWLDNTRYLNRKRIAK